MKASKEFLVNAITILSVVFCLVPCGSFAQKMGIKRTELQRHQLSVPGFEAIQVRVDFEPGAAFGMHSHPGEEIINVLEGSLEYEIEGQRPVVLKAGDVLFIPAGKNHSAKNAGKGNASELATYIVQEGRPLVVLKEEGTAVKKGQ